MEYSPINFREKLSKFSELWSPKVVARLNDLEFRLAKIEGEFVWHSHAETDEAFVVIDGVMRIEMRGGVVRLRAGEMFVVPRGVEHRPVAEGVCSVMLVEPAGTVNTGGAGGDLTAPNDVWV
jgi:mannose-6-phosphate isomerase-like protein (cupin superfamily)